MKIRLFFIYGLFIASILGLENQIFAQKSKTKYKRKKVALVKKKIINPQICGNIIKLTGNQLPDPDREPSKGQVFTGEILIYKPTKIADTEGDGATKFTKIKTKLVKKTWTDKTGKFCINLPIGKYSIFINDPDYGLFANTFDGEMTICPIEIVKGKNKEISLQITHSAAF